MARLFGDTVLRALDSNGNPVSGARLRVFVAGTTTPLTAYTDAALTTPHASPIVADSAGVFPAVYVLTGPVKVTITTADDAALPGSPIDYVPAFTGDGAASTSLGAATLTVTGGVRAQTLAAKLGEQLSIRDFIAPGSGDHTAGVQAAFDYVGTNGGTLDVSGIWNVSKVVISVGTQPFNVIGTAFFVANSENSQTALFEITRGNFLWEGYTTFNCAYRTNYAAGVWVYAEQIQAVKACYWNLYGCTIGLRVGDAANGDAVVSEVSFDGISSYGTPRPLQVEGANTYVTFMNPRIVADGFGGDTAWQARAKRALVVIGGFCRVIGNELIQPASPSATDYLIEIQPSLWPDNDLSWGRVRCTSVDIETAGPLAVTTNPSSLTGPNPEGNRGLIEFVACHGYHSQDNAAFILTDSTYNGDVVVRNCDWWCPVSRTQANIACNGTNAIVDVDERGFGAGFMSPLGGTLGGVVRFSRRLIMEVLGVTNSTATAGLNTVVFQTATATGDFARFATAYNTTTGIFTVPTGGLREMTIKAQVYCAGVTGTLSVYNGDSEVASTPFSGPGQVEYSARAVAADQTFSIRLNVASGAGSSFSALGFLHRLHIEAAN